MKRERHGKSNTQEYHIWRDMINRCHLKSRNNYARYGGSGIKVCERWLLSFSDFLYDVGRRPSKNHSLDRIDNKRGYSPENVRWATRKEQARNTKNNVLITFNGETYCVTEWAEILGMNPFIIFKRLNRKWTVNRLFEKPAQPKIIEINGVKKTIKQWANETGLKYGDIAQRIKNGCPNEKLIAPKRKMTFKDIHWRKRMAS